MQDFYHQQKGAGAKASVHEHQLRLPNQQAQSLPEAEGDEEHRMAKEDLS